MQVFFKILHGFRNYRTTKGTFKQENRGSTTTIEASPPNSSLVGEGLGGRGLMDFFYNGKEMPNETLLLARFKGMPCLLNLPKKRSVPSVMLKCLAWRLPTIPP